MKRLLLISTRPHLVNWVNETLLGSKWSVHVAVTEPETLLQVRRAPPSLILMDLLISFRNGCDLTREIINQNNELIAIGITNLDTHGHRLAAMRSAMRDLIVLPCAKAEFYFTIEKYTEDLNAEAT